VSLASLDLNLLLVLDTVLAEHSVLRAARRLHVTPSAVSNALARLRAALDDPLVTRSGRGIVPTPRALELAPVLSRAMRELDDAVNARAFDPAVSLRQITLAVGDAGQIALLPRLTALLAAEMPRTTLRVVGIDTLVAAGGLAGAEVDATIGAGERGPGVQVAPLYEERLVLVARRDSLPTTISKTRLASLRHVEVHVAAGRPNRDLANSYARIGIARDVAVIVPTFTAAAAVVSTTDLVATLPERAFERIAAGFDLQPIAAPVHPPNVAIRLAWHERTHHDPAMRAFRDLVQRAAPSPRARPASRGPRFPQPSRRRRY
jgi:DNA-binding transcriptional LysR family regulator